MSDWTNLEEIMQDLSVAQGCAVPASLETFGADGPPAYHVQEETEQPHYESTDTAGRASTGPDYNLIQVMLDMVKETSDNHESDLLSDPISRESPQRNKIKVNRNVALTSIMAAKEAEKCVKQPISADVIPTMFKRKATSRPGLNTDLMSPPQIVTPEHLYTPSTHAKDYQSKYLDNEQIFEDNIWSIVEQKMKVVEARKKPAAQPVTPEVRGFAAVHLDQHRHEFCDDCIVCIVAYKHGYNF